MAKQAINVGTTANDKKGDSLRAAFQKVNANFTELYEAVGLATAATQDTTLTFLGSTLSTDDSSSIVIDRATTVTSNLSVGGDIVPQTALGGDLGSSTLPWRSLYVSNNTIFIGGTAVGLDANGNLTTGGTVVGSTPAWANITGKPTFATVATTGAYADLTGKPTIPTLVSQLANDSGFLTSVSNIQSESDVSIQVNLTDSTLRRWQFGEDGNLTFPDGTNQSTAYQTSIVRAQRASGGISTTLDKWTFTTVTGSVTAEWVVDGAAAYPALGLGSNPYIIFTLTGFTKLPETFYRLGVTGSSPGLTNNSSAPANMTNATSPNILTAFNPTLHKYVFSEGSTIAEDIYWEFRI